MKRPKAKIDLKKRFTTLHKPTNRAQRLCEKLKQRAHGEDFKNHGEDRIDELAEFLANRRTLNDAYCRLLASCDHDDSDLADAITYGRKILEIDEEIYSHSINEAQRFLAEHDPDHAIQCIKELVDRGTMPARQA
jgi:hypothetical protein